MSTAVLKLQGEFYFRFSSAYHVTLSRGLYPRQGTIHNGHQRATWYCLQSTTHSEPQTTQLAVPVDVGENFPLMWQFCTSYTGGVFRSLSARTSPDNWSSKSKTPARLPDETGKNPALQEASYTEDTGGGSVQHAAIALIRPRRQQHLRLPAITCDTHCKVYNRTTPVFANYKVSCLNYK